MTKKKLSSPVLFHFLYTRFRLINRTEAKACIQQIFEKEKKKLAIINYIFCNRSYLLKLNKTYLSHDFHTDILSFSFSGPGEGIIADIYISVEMVRDNARLFKCSFQEELHRVIFHGALHLCGYSDKTKEEKLRMRKAEDHYLALYFA